MLLRKIPQLRGETSCNSFLVSLKRSSCTFLEMILAQGELPDQAIFLQRSAYKWLSVDVVEHDRTKQTATLNVPTQLFE